MLTLGVEVSKNLGELLLLVLLDEFLVFVGVRRRFGPGGRGRGDLVPDVLCDALDSSQGLVPEVVVRLDRSRGSGGDVRTRVVGREEGADLVNDREEGRGAELGEVVLVEARVEERLIGCERKFTRS